MKKKLYTLFGLLLIFGSPFIGWHFLVKIAEIIHAQNFTQETTRVLSIPIIILSILIVVYLIKIGRKIIIITNPELKPKPWERKLRILKLYGLFGLLPILGSPFIGWHFLVKIIHIIHAQNFTKETQNVLDILTIILSILIVVYLIKIGRKIIIYTMKRFDSEIPPEVRDKIMKERILEARSFRKKSVNSKIGLSLDELDYKH